MLRIGIALTCLTLLAASLAGCHASGSIGENMSTNLVARWVANRQRKARSDRIPDVVV